LVNKVQTVASRSQARGMAWIPRMDPAGRGVSDRRL